MSLRIHSSLITAIALAVAPAYLAAQSAPKVGPPRGTVVVVGGGSMGPEIYQRFIDAAGGPNALIIDVPTAGGDSVYKQDAPGTRGWKQAGAKNIYVLHTTDRKLADSDSFAAILRKAGGVWFEGGRQFHLVDSYAGTKTEQGFHDVLARGASLAARRRARRSSAAFSCAVRRRTTT
jgi:cyanophycinase-like exopeptidase